MPRTPRTFDVNGTKMTSNTVAELCGISSECARIRFCRFRAGKITVEQVLKKNGRASVHQRPTQPTQEWRKLKDKSRPVFDAQPGTWERQHIPDRGDVGSCRTGRPQGAIARREQPAFSPGQFAVPFTNLFR